MIEILSRITTLTYRDQIQVLASTAIDDAADCFVGRIIVSLDKLPTNTGTGSRRQHDLFELAQSIVRLVGMIDVKSGALGIVHKALAIDQSFIDILGPKWSERSLFLQTGIAVEEKQADGTVIERCYSISSKDFKSPPVIAVTPKAGGGGSSAGAGSSGSETPTSRYMIATEAHLYGYRRVKLDVFEKSETERAIWSPDPKRRDAVSVLTAHQRLARTKTESQVTQLEAKQLELSTQLTAKTNQMAIDRAAIDRKMRLAAEEQKKQLSVQLRDQQKQIDDAADAAAAAQAKAFAALNAASEGKNTPATVILKSIASLRKDLKDVETELLARVEKLTQQVVALQRAAGKAEAKHGKRITLYHTANGGAPGTFAPNASEIKAAASAAAAAKIAAENAEMADAIRAAVRQRQTATTATATATVTDPTDPDSAAALDDEDDAIVGAADGGEDDTGTDAADGRSSPSPVPVSGSRTSHRRIDSSSLPRLVSMSSGGGSGSGTPSPASAARRLTASASVTALPTPSKRVPNK